MFPTRFFPARFFPGRFWPKLRPGPPPPPEAADLFGALQAGYLTAGLGTAVGPLTSDLALRTAVPPYVVATLTDAGVALATNTSTIHESRLALKCRASTVEQAGAMAASLDGWLMPDPATGRRFRWNGGTSGPLSRTGWTKGAERGTDRNGEQVFFDLLTYSVKIKGVR